MYKRILAPVDGSEFAECSLEHVRAIASGCRVPEVVLLTVIEPLPVTGYDIGEELLRNAGKSARAWAEDYLAKVADSLKSEGIAVRTAVVQGRAAEEILDYARSNKVDLIIMSTHGGAGISRWLFGNVANKILHHSTVPVLMTSPAACRIS